MHLAGRGIDFIFTKIWQHAKCLGHIVQYDNHLYYTAQDLRHESIMHNDKIAYRNFSPNWLNRHHVCIWEKAFAKIKSKTEFQCIYHVQT